MRSVSAAARYGRVLLSSGQLSKAIHPVTNVIGAPTVRELRKIPNLLVLTFMPNGELDPISWNSRCILVLDSQSSSIQNHVEKARPDLGDRYAKLTCPGGHLVLHAQEAELGVSELSLGPDCTELRGNVGDQIRRADESFHDGQLRKDLRSGDGGSTLD